MALNIPSTTQARWRVLHDVVRQAAYGRSYSYAELNALAGVTDIRTERWILLRTRTELLRHDQRYLDNVRGVGYRIVRAGEHLDVAHAYRRRSMRQAGKSVKVLEATDLAAVQDPVVRQNISNLQSRMSRVEQTLRYQNARLENTERTTARLGQGHVDHSDRLAAIEEKLRKMAGDSEK